LFDWSPAILAACLSYPPLVGQPAIRGPKEMIMARMPSGFAVIGDTQHLQGYSVLLCDDETVNHLTDLDWERRKTFLFDLSLLGEAVQVRAAETGCAASTKKC
jgi:hypothetical protein